MTLVEQGKINLDEPASRYLSDLPPAWHEVTVLQLLTHTSGIPDFRKSWATAHTELPPPHRS